MAIRQRSSQVQVLTKKPVVVSNTPPKLRKKKRPPCWLWIISLLFTLYILSMVALRYCTWIQQAVTYVHHLRQPFFRNLSDIASFGIEQGREFSLSHEDGCEIKVWHILPISYRDHNENEILLESDYVEALKTDSPVILYLHGNTGTRALQHRIDVYKFFSARGYHVLTFDYRGFGNSACYPSEKGMMEDALLVWNWIKSTAPDSRVYIWGHSLGSAAATYVAKELCEKEIGLPNGLILDAPFTDLSDAAAHHPLSLPFWPIQSLYKYFVLDGFAEPFRSVERVKHITSPMLILHGRQDRIIPYHIGEKFYKMAVGYKSDYPKMGDVEFVDCGESNHKKNYLSEKTVDALIRFIK